MSLPRLMMSPLCYDLVIYLPGYHQFGFAASTTTDVCWGDLRDCAGDKNQVIAKAQEDLAKVTHFKHIFCHTHLSCDQKPGG